MESVASSALHPIFYRCLLRLLGLQEQESVRKTEQKWYFIPDKENPSGLFHHVLKKLQKSEISGTFNSQDEQQKKALESCTVWICQKIFRKAEDTLLQNKGIVRTDSFLKFEDKEEKYKILFQDSWGDWEFQDSEFFLLWKKIANISEKNQKNRMFNHVVEQFFDSLKFNSINNSLKTEFCLSPAIIGLVFEKLNGTRDGAFYTPPMITEFISKELVERTIVKKLNAWAKENGINFQSTLNAWQNYIHTNKQNSRIKSGVETILWSLRFCDPAVGVGHILVSVLNQLVSAYNNISNAYIPTTEQESHILQFRMHIIEKGLFGMDVNPTSIFICRLRLWLEVLQWIENKDKTVSFSSEKFGANIQIGNSLLHDWPIQFDGIIMNPPYVPSTKLQVRLKSTEIDALNQKYFNKSNGKKCLFNDLFELFFYLAHKLAKPEGLIGVVCSDSFTTISNYEKFRSFLFSKMQLSLWKPCPSDAFSSEDPNGALVSTSIFLFYNTPEPNNEIFIHPRMEKMVGFLKSEPTIVHLSDFTSSIRSSMWIPSEFIKIIFEKIISVRSGREFIRFGDLVAVYTRMETPNNSEYLAVHENDTKYAHHALNFQHRIPDIARSSAGKKLHGKVWKIIGDRDIIPISNLSVKERLHGTEGKWIPLIKGSGVTALDANNRYYSEHHYFINWDRNALAQYGMAGKDHFWRTGLYWSLATESNASGFLIKPTGRLKFALKPEGPNDVNFKAAILKPEWQDLLYYLLGIMNTRLIFQIKWNFINSTTANQQIDINEIPIRLPKANDRKFIEDRVSKCIELLKNRGKSENLEKIKQEIKTLEQEIEEKTWNIYEIPWKLSHLIQ